MSVKKGDKIKVDYTGSLEDGSVFDTSEGKQPLEFEAGVGMVIKGFDDAVIGMKVGEEKEVKIPVDQAYGQPNPEMIKKFPRAQLPAEPKPEVGMMIAVGTPDGQKFPAKIAEVSDTEVSLDLNHPLAGKALKFKLKLVEIVK